MNGSAVAAHTAPTVPSTSAVPGRLARAGPPLRITRTTVAADTTDSTNQPVRNSVGLACSIQRSTPNVA